MVFVTVSGIAGEAGDAAGCMEAEAGATLGAGGGRSMGADAGCCCGGFCWGAAGGGMAGGMLVSKLVPTIISEGAMGSGGGGGGAGASTGVGGGDLNIGGNCGITMESAELTVHPTYRPTPSLPNWLRRTITNGTRAFSIS